MLQNFFILAFSHYRVCFEPAISFLPFQMGLMHLADFSPRYSMLAFRQSIQLCFGWPHGHFPATCNAYATFVMDPGPACTT